MTEATEVALITGLCVGIPSLLGSFAAAWMNRMQLNNIHATVTTIETNTNSKLDLLLKQRDAAVTKSDLLEGQIAGAKAEQERIKS